MYSAEYSAFIQYMSCFINKLEPSSSPVTEEFMKIAVNILWMKSSENSSFLIATVFPEGNWIFWLILGGSFEFCVYNQDYYFFFKVKIYIRLSSQK